MSDDRSLALWTSAIAVALTTIVIVVRRRYRRIHERDAMPPRVTSCTLLWGHPNKSCACFCRPTIRLDLSKHTSPDVELVAAIFGSPPASEITLTRAADGSVVQPHGDGDGDDDASSLLALVVGETYTVTLSDAAIAAFSSSSNRDVVPIKEIYQSIRGGQPSIAALSHAFYRRVFADDADAAFRALFAGSAGSAEAAAENQWRWLVEMWGGPSLYSKLHGDGALVRRMLSKHGESRMTSRFCRRWLEHMMEATDEVSAHGI